MAAGNPFLDDDENLLASGAVKSDEPTQEDAAARGGAAAPAAAGPAGYPPPPLPPQEVAAVSAAAAGGYLPPGQETNPFLSLPPDGAQPHPVAVMGPWGSSQPGQGADGISSYALLAQGATQADPLHGGLGAMGVDGANGAVPPQQGVAWTSSDRSRYQPFEQQQAGGPPQKMRCWGLGEMWTCFIVSFLIWPGWYVGSVWYCASPKLQADPR